MYKRSIFSLLFTLIFLFSCEKAKLPVLSTSAVTNITVISAVSGGNISDDGGAVISAKGLCWSLTDKPTINDHFINDISDGSVFTGTLTGLLPKTQYFVRAFAVNREGTGYGESRSFTTLGDLPSSVTVTPDNLTINSGVLNGTVNPCSLSTVVTFEWGISNAYGNVATPRESPITGPDPQNLSVEINGLSPGTIYHFRIKAENSLGVNYSSDMIFKTLGVVPEITSPGTTEITLNTSRLTVSVNPNYLPTTVKFEWGTSSGYGNTIILQNPIDGSSPVGLGTVVSGLTLQTTYHYRIVASNELGTTRTNDMTFTTYAVADMENNYYHSVTLGSQIWLAENLRSTRFNDGTPIPFVTEQNIWNTTHNSAYCWYDNDPSNKDSYGALYNRWATERSMNGNKNLCPAGWHVPAKSEWTELLVYLSSNGFGNDGSGDDIAKSIASKNGWDNYGSPGTVGNNPEINNSSGFTALPGGIRTDGSQGFIMKGMTGQWWGDPDDPSLGYYYWCTSIYNYEAIVRQQNASSNTGLSVRCIKD